jgi:hypothetical protein
MGQVQPTTTAPGGKTWFYCQIHKPLPLQHDTLESGTKIAITGLGNARWQVLTLRDDGEQNEGEITTQQFSASAKYTRGPEGKQLVTQDPSLADLNKQLGIEDEGGEDEPPVTTGQEPGGEDKPVQKGGAKMRLIPDDKISDEQRKIDEYFGEMMGGEVRNHMMINALAGTGKTSMLVHLAWKYGKPGQNWLYIVFNKKNRIEAKGKFPKEWVTPETSNSFLGKVLGGGGGGIPGVEQNKRKIAQTDRAQDEQNGLGTTKIRALADSPEFSQMMTKLGVPAGIPCPRCQSPLQKPSGKFFDAFCSSCGNEPYRQDWEGNDEKSRKYGGTGNRILNIIAGFNGLQYCFKERVLKLVGLAKAFAGDPRMQLDLEDKIDFLIQDHDVDTTLEEFKEKLSKFQEKVEGYKPRYRRTVLSILAQAFPGGLEELAARDFTNEIKQAAVWMLSETMPGKSSILHSKDGMQHNLGEFRDFDDDIWYAAMHADEIDWPHYDVVLADEVQDFNQGQIIMLRKLAEAGARVVAVGDPNQAIYRFRGGEAEAFQSLSGAVSDWSQDKEGAVKGITQNFRSKPAILDFATAETGIKGLTSGKEWAEGDTGVVTSGEINYDDSFAQIGGEREQGQKMETAFIARTNAPLVHAALKLLAQGVPFVIMGKEIGRELRAHIKKMMNIRGIYENGDITYLQRTLSDYHDEELNAHGGKSTKKGYLAELKETTDALLASIETFMNEVSGGTVAQFQKWLDMKLGSHTLEFEEGKERDIEADMAKFEAYMAKEKPIVLTTAHRSKGLEFDRVFILRYDEFPHPKTLKKKHPKDLQQETNMKYVALTRAKNEIHVLDLNGQPGYKPPTRE